MSDSVSLRFLIFVLGVWEGFGDDDNLEGKGGWGFDWVEGREGEGGEEGVRRGWGEMWGKREGKGEREREARVSKL